MNESFGREEKLKNKILITRVFADGHSITRFPLKLVYLPIESPAAPLNQAGVSVPKRSFKRAVDRIHLKRLMRESYRKNKYLVESKGQGYALMFIYISKQKEEYHRIFEATEELMKKISGKIKR